MYNVISVIFFAKMF